jgi:DhnA family fructose-bisphosphate aldolase class Ia
MGNKQYRLKELFNSIDGRSLILDTSQGLVRGVLPGLEHYREALTPLLGWLDGGQARTLGAHTSREAALLLRADWTNGLRSGDFVLPPESIHYLPLLEPGDALELGASALVMHFILGHEEQIEADCLKQVVHLSLEGMDAGMPLIVEVQPIGPRVVLRGKAIELGVSYALEGGADGMVIPWPGSDSFQSILQMMSGLPVWVKAGDLEAKSVEITEAFSQGAAGIWLDERLFANADPPGKIRALRDLVHGKVALK